MEINNFIINTGNPIKSSIPLAQKQLGRGFGFSRQANKNESDGTTIELSLSATKNSLKSNDNSNSGYASKSPLTQALDALTSISDQISVLQDKYSKSAPATKTAESLSSELNSLVSEFKRISEQASASAKNKNSTNLDYKDSLVVSLMASGDTDRINDFSEGIEALKNISFDDILTDKGITKNIDKIISQIKATLSKENENTNPNSTSVSNTESLLIPAPFASIKTIGAADGLSLSLLSYSNEDLIKAAATKMDISSTNVLILTYNAEETEEETKEEKEEREKKSQKIELENPTELPTLADR